MTRTEKLERLAVLERRNEEQRKELAELRKELEAEDNDATWPQVGDKYFSIEVDGTICDIPCVWGEDTGFADQFDAGVASIGNIFKTIEEAEFVRERLKVLAEMKKYTCEPKNIANVENLNIEGQWTIALERHTGGIRPACLIFDSFGYLVFEEEKDAQACIDAIGKDRLMKYWFGV